jgi:hypothetical protein
MKKNIITILLLLAVMACDNSLEINAPYREIPVVYGFIDKNETVQYLRIQKVFQNSIEIKANDAVKITDSLYLKNLLVQIIVNKDTINCTRTNKIPKNAGLFANDSNYIYQTNSYNWLGVGLAKVNLLIRDTVTGNIFTSSCNLIGDQIIKPRNITISERTNNIFTFEFLINKSANVIDAAVRLKYIEATINNPTNFTEKYLDYYVQSGYETANYEVDAKVLKQVKSLDLLNNWRQFFAKQPTSVIRKYIGVEYVTWGAGQDFLKIQEMNKPNISFVQKRTDFTNIEGGLGIFGARTKTILTGIEFADINTTDSSRIFISQLPGFVK